MLNSIQYIDYFLMRPVWIWSVLIGWFKMFENISQWDARFHRLVSFIMSITVKPWLMYNLVLIKCNIICIGSVEFIYYQPLHIFLTSFYKQ
jgi:hypothetical protein